MAASAKSVPGVKAVEFDGQMVTVTYYPEQATPEAIVEAIERGVGQFLGWPTEPLYF